MTTLKRMKSAVLVPATPSVPATPGWYEYVAGPSLENTTSLPEKTNLGSIFGWAGASAAPSSTPTVVSTPASAGKTGGGSTGGTISEYYTVASYNSERGLFGVTVLPNGSVKVIRL